MKKFILLLSIILLISGCSCYPAEPIEKEKIDKNHNVMDKSQENISEYNEQVDEVPIDIEQEEVAVSKDAITLSFIGDIMTDSYIGQYIMDYGNDYPWQHVSRILNADDITFANLETSVSERGKTYKPEGFGFRSKPSTLEGIYNAGIDTVSLANNHSLDFGEEALIDTMSYLSQYNINYVGAGIDKTAAEAPIIINSKDYTVGFIAYNSIIPWESWKASEQSSGTASFSKNDTDNIMKNIEQIKDTCDLLFVVLHWGVEYSNTPEEWQIQLAHQIIDAGADGVIGHHPHILQGIEIYKEKPILYSIGNFVFLKYNEAAGKTGIFQLEYKDDVFKSIQFYPVEIMYCKADLYDTESVTGIEYINLLQELSQPFGTQVQKDGSILP